MSLYLQALLTITILSVAPGLTVAGFADSLQKIVINTNDFKDNSTSLDESAVNFSTTSEQKENIHKLSTDSKINDLSDMVNTTNTRLDMLTSQSHTQALLNQLEASINALGESGGNFATTYEQEENIHKLSTDSKTNDLSDMVNTTNTRLDMLTSQSHTQALLNQLEASINALDELLKNDSIASQQEKRIYIPVHQLKKSWTEAFADCRERGMDLASIESEVEYQKVMEKITSIGKRPKHMDFWISGKMHVDEVDVQSSSGRKFKWMSNGHNVTYNKWYKGQPDQDEVCSGGKLDYCLEINQRHDNEWNDYCCSFKQFYICQIDI